MGGLCNGWLTRNQPHSCENKSRKCSTASLFINVCQQKKKKMWNLTKFWLIWVIFCQEYEWGLAGMKRGFAQVVKRRMQPRNGEAALLRSSQDQVSEPGITFWNWKTFYCLFCNSFMTFHKFYLLTVFLLLDSRFYFHTDDIILLSSIADYGFECFEIIAYNHLTQNAFHPVFFLQ